MVGLIKRSTRDANAPAVCQSLQPRRHIHPIPVEGPFRLDHIPEVDSDAELHSAALRKVRIPRLQLVLDGNPALDRIHNAPQTQPADCLPASL